MLNMVFDDKENKMSDVSKTQSPAFSRALCIIFLAAVTIVPFMLAVFFELSAVKSAYDIYSKHQISMPIEIFLLFTFSGFLSIPWFYFLATSAERLDIKINGKELTDNFKKKFVSYITIMIVSTALFAGDACIMINNFLEMKNMNIMHEVMHMIAGNVMLILISSFVGYLLLKYLIGGKNKSFENAS